jgi:hypothetical protein
MQVIFCRPLAPQRQADRFELEADALDELGIEHHWIATELVVDGELELALSCLPEASGELLYRGWMLTEEHYSELFEALCERGLQLIPRRLTAAAWLKKNGRCQRYRSTPRWRESWAASLTTALTPGCKWWPMSWTIRWWRRSTSRSASTVRWCSRLTRSG